MNKTEAELCLYRKARKWSNTTIVSIPTESCKQLNIEEGTPLKIQVTKLRVEEE